jgi:hypothetical protein
VTKVAAFSYGDEAAAVLLTELFWKLLMPTRTSVLTQSPHLSISEAIQAYHMACDLTDVQRAYACLQTFTARVKQPDEDDVGTCDGLTSIMRLINVSLKLREEAAAAALQAMLEAVERECAQ